MAKVLSNQFKLTGAIGSKVLLTGVEMVSGVLYQSMDAAGNLSPDWTDAGPKFKVWVMDTGGITRKSIANDGQGNDYEKLYWNGALVTFGSNGLSGALGAAFPAGTFKRTTATDGTYVYQIMKNFFSESANADSDQFRIDGKIELAGGNFQDFTTPDQPVTLVRYSNGGLPYMVVVTPISNITTPGGTGILEAVLLKMPEMTVVTQNNSSTPVTPTKWYNVDGTGAENECTAQGYIKSGNRLTVPADEVHGYDNFCAMFTVGDKQYRGYAPIFDVTDNLYAAYNVLSGATGEEVSEGETARVHIFMTNKEGIVLTSWGNKTMVPHVVLKDHEQNPITPVVYSGTADALLNSATEVTNITYKGEAWKGALAVPYEKLMSDCGGTLQGWISLDPAV